jgi:hypothetical protein
MAKRKKPHPTMVRLDAELYERVESWQKADRGPVATYFKIGNGRCDRCSDEPRGSSRMSEKSTSDEIEQRAVAHAFGLLAAVRDAKAAKLRLEQLTATARMMRGREPRERPL